MVKTSLLNSRAPMLGVFASCIGLGLVGVFVGPLACSAAPPSETEQVREEVAADVPAQCGEEGSLELYERRIEPLFEADRPKSCSQCHLSGLDLSLYQRETPCEMLVCLVSSGLVNTKRPEDSKLLGWVGRAEPESTLITERVVAEEYEGLRQWIEYNLRCDTCKGVECPSTEGDYKATYCEGTPELATGFDPASVDPGGCDRPAIETLYRNTIYSARGRCAPCHYTDHEFDEAKIETAAPQWLDVTGECEEAVSRSLRVVEARGLMNLEDASQSLLLLKPLKKELGGIKHLGHEKFYSKTEDPAYVAFLYFIERYIACAASDP
jgi:hypothetical protein